MLTAGAYVFASVKAGLSSSGVFLGLALGVAALVLWLKPKAQPPQDPPPLDPLQPIKDLQATLSNHRPDFSNFPPAPHLKHFSDGWFVYNFFAGYVKAASIVEAIKNNVRLVTMYKEFLDSKLSFMDGIVRRNLKSMENSPWFAPEYALYFFYSYLPDQYELIVSTPGGQEWLASNFEEMKAYFSSR